LSSKFFYFEVFDNSYDFTLNRLFAIVPNFRFRSLRGSQHRRSVRKRRKAVKPSSTSEFLISHDALLALCIELLWAKLFLKRVPRHFWTLQSQHYAEKKTSPTCFNRLLWKELRRKDLVLFGFSKEKLVGTLPLLWNMGFHNKTACKNILKIVLSKILLTSRCKRCRNYVLRFHCYTHFYWIQYIF